MAHPAVKNLRNIRSMRHQTSKSTGFTLVEVLIIAPIVILAIGAFVAIMVSVVGEVLVTRNATSQTNDIHSALDQIEQDVKLSLEFPVTTGSLPSPQGRNNNFTGTSAFTSADSNTLVLQTAATNSDGIMYYANQPNPCPEVDIYDYPDVVYNRVFTISNMYFIKDNALWKRTYVPTYNLTVASPNQSTLCSESSPRQRNTCSPGYTASRCQTQDTKLIENVTALSTAFFATGDSTTNVGAGNSATATTVEVSITASTKSAGEPIATTMKRRMSKLDQANPTSTTSQWTDWSDAELNSGWDIFGSVYDEPGYIKTSGGVVFLKGLLQRSTGGPNANGTVVATLPPGYRPLENINLPVSAQSSTGTNKAAVVQVRTNGDIQIHYVTGDWVSLNGVGFLLNGEYPMTNLTLLNGWTTDIVGRELRYGVDGMGRTHMRGQIQQGTFTAGTPVASPPSSVLPTERYYFAAGSTLDSLPYEVRQGCPGICARGTSSTWMSVSNMVYPATFNGWTNLTLGGGWAHYTGDYTTPQYTKAADGVVTVKGLVRNGSTTAGTVLATLPPGYRPAKRQIFPAIASGPLYARLDVEPDGDILINGVPNNSWLTLTNIKFVAEQ